MNLLSELRTLATQKMYRVRDLVKAVELAKYDPDQTRDPQGKWSSGGGTVTAFHGTLKSQVESIGKQGLKVGKPRTFTKKGKPDAVLYEGDRGKAVFVSNTKSTALWYARQREFAKGGTPVVLTLAIPKSAWKSFKNDEEHQGKGAAYSLKSIKPSWIVKAEAEDFNRSRYEIPFRKDEEDLLILYVGIVLEKGEELEKAEPISGDLCRGEGGLFESCGAGSSREGRIDFQNKMNEAIKAGKPVSVKDYSHYLYGKPEGYAETDNGKLYEKLDPSKPIDKISTDEMFDRFDKLGRGPFAIRSHVGLFYSGDATSLESGFSDPEKRKEIEEEFAPRKAMLQEKFGDSVVAYRATSTGTASRKIFSYTLKEKVARTHKTMGFQGRKVLRRRIPIDAIVWAGNRGEQEILVDISKLPEGKLYKAEGLETRPSCLQCVEKHLGAAMVQMAEVRDGYEYRLRIIGHLHEAEDEAQEYNDLHDAIRDARKAWQEKGTVPDWEKLSEKLERLQKSNDCHDEDGKFCSTGSELERPFKLDDSLDALDLALSTKAGRAPKLPKDPTKADWSLGAIDIFHATSSDNVESIQRKGLRTGRGTTQNVQGFASAHDAVYSHPKENVADNDASRLDELTGEKGSGAVIVARIPLAHVKDYLEKDEDTGSNPETVYDIIKESFGVRADIPPEYLLRVAGKWTPLLDRLGDVPVINHESVLETLGKSNDCHDPETGEFCTIDGSSPLSGQKSIIRAFGGIRKLDPIKGYVLHGTTSRRLASIKEKGLRPSQGSWITDKPSVHFTEQPTEAIGRGEPDVVLLRMKSDAVVWDKNTRRPFMSSKKISPDKLEVLTEKGWKPLQKNCGIGEGGFQEGNTCGRGDGVALEQKRLGVIKQIKEKFRPKSQADMDERKALLLEDGRLAVESWQERNGQINTSPTREIGAATTTDAPEEVKLFKIREKYVADDEKTLSMNARLRDGGKATTKVKEMDTYCSSGEIQSDGALYRGALLQPYQIKEISELVGKGFVDKGFASTSPKLATAEFYAESRQLDRAVDAGEFGHQTVVFHIEVSKGQKVGVMDKDETVLPRNSRMKINGVEFKNNRWKVDATLIQ